MDEEKVGKVVRRELAHFFDEGVGRYFDGKFKEVDERLDKVDERLDKVESRLGGVEQEIVEMKETINGNTKMIEKLAEVTTETRSNHENRIRVVEDEVGIKPISRLRF